MRPRFFGMVSLGRSLAYTRTALRTFALHTRLRPGDRFLLIDGDATFDAADLLPPGSEVVSTGSPAGFAANMNRVLAAADAAGADAYLLNNDLAFTAGWDVPLDAGPEVVTSPLSNRESPYHVGEAGFGISATLGHYLGREWMADDAADAARAGPAGLVRVMSLPFFCVRIPAAVYRAVGRLDERFGAGGAEDNDYCLRCCLASIPVAYVRRSWVLHFSGKSTWDGGESDEEAGLRRRAYRSAFEAKWGPELLALVVSADPGVLERRPDLAAHAAAGRFGELVRALLPPGAARDT